MTEKSSTPVATLALGAARIRSEAEAWRGHHPVAGDLKRADDLDARIREPLPDRLRVEGAGGELVPHAMPGLPKAEYRSTVAKPDYVAAAASRDRLDLAHEAGALEAGLDAADTIEARNSLEQMLAHQLGAAHRSVLKLTAQLNRQIERMAVLVDDRRQLANLEATRTANAVARLMLAFQQGATTVQRLRTGGRQVVTVQHVAVGPGGQAIVAGAVTTGGRGEGEGGGENEQ